MATTTADQTNATAQASTTPATTTAAQANRSGGTRDMLNQNLGKAKAFAKQRPAATAALAGVLGLALLNTLRGR